MPAPPARLPPLHRIARFVFVGCVAAGVHLATVVLLVERMGLAPLAANVGGWLLAFCVSFLGQWRLTFASGRSPWTVAVRRFFLISLVGFALNEAAYAAMLQWSPLGYAVGLAVVLVGVAVATYLLGSRWAFQDE